MGKRKATCIKAAAFVLLALLLLLLVGKRRLLSTEPSKRSPPPRRDDGVLIFSPPGIQGEAHRDVKENERSRPRLPAIGTHISLPRRDDGVLIFSPPGIQGGAHRDVKENERSRPRLPPIGTHISLPRRDDGVLIFSPPGIQGGAHRDVKENERSRPRLPPIGTHISLDTYAPVRVVDPQFLSVTLEAGDIRSNWASIDFTAPRIISMARALNPAMLRVGGTSQDFLTFNASTTERIGSPATSWKYTQFTMTPLQWDRVNKFVNVVGWEFIFGLNALCRFPYNSRVWNSKNAKQLISYSRSKSYDVHWELGNEPNTWKKPIAAGVHAKDFAILSKVLYEEKQLSRMIVGPGVTGVDREYFTEFVKSVPQGILSATTYHHYYGRGKTGKRQNFYDVNLLDLYISKATFFQSTTEKLQPQADVWLGETASRFGGGTPHLSNSYVAGFMWLDTLGIAAAVGHKRVFRQTFVWGNYGLLNFEQNPMPDYWLSVLYKRLVGTKVLHVDGGLERGRHLRVYAHCAKSPYPEGSVVLVLLNVDFRPVEVSLLNSELVSSERDIFWLLPPAGNLTSTSVQLNGVLLQLVADTELPNFSPEKQSAGPSLSLPDISFGFVVFKNAQVKACL